MITGYQQAILLGIGSWNGDRFTVRSKSQHYVDAVQPVLGGKVYMLDDAGHGKPQFVVKQLVSNKSFYLPTINDIADWKGFSRGWIELHGGIYPCCRKSRKGYKYYVPSLRVWGSESILNALQEHLPIAHKKLQRIRNSVESGKYTGETFELRLQSASETFDVLEFCSYVDGSNDEKWEQFYERYRLLSENKKL